MAFRTKYEQQKWDRLEKEARQSVELFRSGKATKRDVENLRTSFSELGLTFVLTMNKTLSDLEQYEQNTMRSIDEHRETHNKPPLNENQREVLSKFAIEHAVQKESTKIIERLDYLLSKNFDSLTEYIGSMFDKFVPGVDEGNKSFADRVNDNVKPEPEKHEDKTEPINTGTNKNNTTELPEQEQPEEDCSASIIGKLADIASRLNPINLLKKKKDEEKEGKDKWWRRLSRYIRDKTEKLSKFGRVGAFGVLFGVLGRLLVASLTGTDVWQPIWDKFKSIVSVKTLEDYGNQFLDFITSKAKSLVDYIESALSGFFSFNDDDGNTTKKVGPSQAQKYAIWAKNLRARADDRVKAGRSPYPYNAIADKYEAYSQQYSTKVMNATFAGKAVGMMPDQSMAKVANPAPPITLGPDHGPITYVSKGKSNTTANATDRSVNTSVVYNDNLTPAQREANEVLNYQNTSSGPTLASIPYSLGNDTVTGIINIGALSGV